MVQKLEYMQPQDPNNSASTLAAHCCHRSMLAEAPSVPERMLYADEAVTPLAVAHAREVRGDLALGCPNHAVGALGAGCPMHCAAVANVPPRDPLSRASGGYLQTPEAAWAESRADSFGGRQIADLLLRSPLNLDHQVPSLPQVQAAEDLPGQEAPHSVWLPDAEHQVGWWA